jgi:16S rRNA (uracil1498-N3)-methyltransferase
MNRIFCEGPLASGAEILLAPPGAYHVARVLRMREGAPLSVFDGSGQEFRAEIVRVAGDDVTVRLNAPIAVGPESPLRITLLQGVSRSERMDWTLQKATELGVATIAPVLTARSVVRLDEKQAQKKQSHWRGIVSAGRATRSPRERTQGRLAPRAEPVGTGIAGGPGEPAEQSGAADRP